MKKLIPLILLCGCSSFSTTQSEKRNDAETLITTKVKARTFWDSKSALANFKALQSEKTQSAYVGSLNTESSGSNTVQLLNAAGDFLKAVGGAAK